MAPFRRAFVEIITSRGKNVGYGVYCEWYEGDQKHGECLHQYRWVGGRRVKNCDTWEVALHLANTHRDDFNSKIT
jgi:hypothetical protein